MAKKFFFLIIILPNSLLTEKLNNAPFPEDFQFGVSTSAHQIEGAWNQGGKGENIWDRFTHEKPDKILDKSNANTACDSYHRLEEDVAVLSELGVQFYHFSLSWSRILPNGFANVVNEEGIIYYNELIDKLISAGITPVVTIFHWDLPVPLQNVGGWPNPLLSDYYTEYSKLVFDKFGDRVKMWLTFNDPVSICLGGYGDGDKAPGIKFSGMAEYFCSYTILKAHASVYHLYNNMYHTSQNGRIGIALTSPWYEAKSNITEDLSSAEKMQQFHFGWFANPIFGSGDYPQVMKEAIAQRSQEEGFEKSRLPILSQEEITYIKGTYDILGLNYFTGLLVAKKDVEIGDSSFWKDTGVEISTNPDWATSEWLNVVPWGLRKLLNWIKMSYGDFDIFITGNGYLDLGGLDDLDRVVYLQLHLSAVVDAIQDGVVVKGYSVWSFFDSFEWTAGFQHKFGLYQIDFKSGNLTRYPKSSSTEYKQIITNHQLPSETRGIASNFRPSLILTTIFLLRMFL